MGETRILHRLENEGIHGRFEETLKKTAGIET
jgi:hypothetical protein